MPNNQMITFTEQAFWMDGCFKDNVDWKVNQINQK
jgi:hypothetical protein